MSELIFIILFHSLGLDSDVVYPQGLSCTLPEDLQQRLINLIPGLERAAIVKPGMYADACI